MAKTKLIWIGFLILSVGIFSFSVDSFERTPYDFQKPARTIFLPKILHEVSGLTDFGENSVACIQDEQGVIFIYDFEKQQITDSIRFAEDDDYEGITKVDDHIFVLRSDGTLFEINLENREDIEVKHYETGISAKDNEGLCYDNDNNRLLIGSKVKNGKGANKNERNIYAFDLKTKTIDLKPVFTLNSEDILDFAVKNKIKLRTKKLKKSNKEVIDFGFGISAIGIHPISKELYVLCAYDHVFLIFNDEGELKEMCLLDEKTYPQAEGITFYENGNMLISNEGQNGEPSLVLFEVDK